MYYWTKRSVAEAAKITWNKQIWSEQKIEEQFCLLERESDKSTKRLDFIVMMVLHVQVEGFNNII